MTYHEVYVAIGSIATAIIAGIIFAQIFLLTKQTKELKKTNLLAHTPFLAPRFTIVGGHRTLVIANVGTGSAIDVRIKLFDNATGDELDPFSRFALGGGESRTTRASFELYSQIRIEGTFSDVSGEQHEIQTVADIDELS